VFALFDLVWFFPSFSAVDIFSFSLGSCPRSLSVFFYSPRRFLLWFFFFSRLKEGVVIGFFIYVSWRYKVSFIFTSTPFDRHPKFFHERVSGVACAQEVTHQFLPLLGETDM